jgi:hypothetical protein
MFGSCLTYDKNQYVQTMEGVATVLDQAHELLEVQLFDESQLERTRIHYSQLKLLFEAECYLE